MIAEVAITLVRKEPQLATLRLPDGTTALKKMAEYELDSDEEWKLVELLCREVKTLNHKDAAEIYADAVALAVENDAYEVFKLIVEAFPNVIYYCAGVPNNTSATDSTTRHKEISIFHMAAKHGARRIFRYIGGMQDAKSLFSNAKDSDGNNLLHLAAKKSPSDVVERYVAAAFEMQDKLEWFQLVYDFVDPDYGRQPNKYGKIPSVVFVEEHEKLIEAAEKWIKDAANSCLVPAVLIATVMFAAAITVPGGNENTNGLPMFAKKKAFIVFMISDIASLLTSTISILIFVSILTSLIDILFVVTNRVMIGLCALFLSVIFMMCSFTSAVYLVFGQKKAWVLIPVPTFACFPVLFFFCFHRTLFDVMISTFRGKFSYRPICWMKVGQWLYGGYCT